MTHSLKLLGYLNCLLVQFSLGYDFYFSALFFLSLSSVLVLFSAFSFLMSVYEYLRGNRDCLLGSEDEDGKNGGLSRDVFICHTNPTAVWTHFNMKCGWNKRGTG